MSSSHPSRQEYLPSMIPWGKALQGRQYSWTHRGSTEASEVYVCVDTCSYAQPCTDEWLIMCGLVTRCGTFIWSMGAIFVIVGNELYNKQFWKGLICSCMDQLLLVMQYDKTLEWPFSCKESHLFYKLTHKVNNISKILLSVYWLYNTLVYFFIGLRPERLHRLSFKIFTVCVWF